MIPLLEPAQFMGFLGAAMLITLAPGPDNLMILSLGAARGRAGGVAFGLGCAIGCLSHTLLAALGIGALIAASPAAFTALKILGGLYLMRLAWFALRSPGGDGHGSASGKESPWRLFGRGLAANAVNPKVIMFFLAFLPQFVDPAQGRVAWQVAELGLLFTVQAALLFALLGYFAGVVGQWILRHRGAGKWLDRIAGVIFLALGLRLIIYH